MCGRIAGDAKPGDAVFTHVHNLLIGSNRLALNALPLLHSAWGTTRILRTFIRRPTTEAGRDSLASCATLLQTCKAPLCVLAGGETTVRVTGQGKGGRTRSSLWSWRQELHKVAGWRLLECGTDGVDGPTDAAGAFVDSRALTGSQHEDRSPGCTRENDTYPLFAALGDLFTPGPTGTKCYGHEKSRCYFSC